ncbi:hypothetical protein [Micromonospora endolithica]|uniref:hypothetical protein n=1 Tax=Micromonospora endolithica TaxID=230091 RepID=UPI0011ADFA51|nr:hypothetical protein [Micromonospora endolithica]TWJ24750.1 hypothetical protein JD76_04906 [Micromonospora endolithica]
MNYGVPSAALILAAIAVFRDAFHWRDDIKAIFLDAGVSPNLYDKHDEPHKSKARIARSLLDDLRASGERGNAIIVRVVEELCRLNKPHRDAPDKRAGYLAIEELKRQAVEANILVSPERAAAEARRAAGRRQAAAVEERRAKIGSLRHSFLELNKAQPRTDADRQRRGYDLERLLADLFRIHEIDYRPPYRTEREQIDGSFHFRGFTYLTEIKWRTVTPDVGDLLTFKGKVDSKIDSTRGVFISMAGFDPAVLSHVMDMARGSRNNIVLFDGRDVALLFEGGFGLIDALTAKVDAAEQEGRMWHPLH